jgi:arginase
VAAEARVPRRVEILGVPFNSSGTTDGVARAPAALRQAGLIERLGAAGIDVRDRGDVELEPTSPERDTASGVIAPAALASTIGSVRDAVDAIVRGGGFPLVLGGDCPILLGCLAAPAVKGVGVLFLDGHEDAWPPAMSTTGEAADMELGFLLGLTTDGLPEELGFLLGLTTDGPPEELIAVLPRLDPEQIVVIGPRDQAEIAAAGVASIDGVVDVIRTAGIDVDAAKVLASDVAAKLVGLLRTWLHVDLDVLSTESLGAVDYPQPGGLDWAALAAFSTIAAADPRLLGLDVTIYNPDLDPTGSGAQRIVEYLVDTLRETSAPVAI